VPYGELLIPFRAYTEERRSHPPTDRVSRLLVLQTLPFPWSFRLGATLARHLAAGLVEELRHTAARVAGIYDSHPYGQP
jgi:hypothetical protein